MRSQSEFSKNYYCTHLDVNLIIEKRKLHAAIGKYFYGIGGFHNSIRACSEESFRLGYDRSVFRSVAFREFPVNPLVTISVIIEIT